MEGLKVRRASRAARRAARRADAAPRSSERALCAPPLLSLFARARVRVLVAPNTPPDTHARLRTHVQRRPSRQKGASCRRPKAMPRARRACPPCRRRNCRARARARAAARAGGLQTRAGTRTSTRCAGRAARRETRVAEAAGDAWPEFRRLGSALGTYFRDEAQISSDSICTVTGRQCNRPETKLLKYVPGCQGVDFGPQSRSDF